MVLAVICLVAYKLSANLCYSPQIAIDQAARQSSSTSPCNLIIIINPQA